MPKLTKVSGPLYYPDQENGRGLDRLLERNGCQGQVYALGHQDLGAYGRLFRDLRLGVFDVLIGINLLREGIDVPEVSLVAILDADEEGFLRNERGAHPDNRSGKLVILKVM